jgi:hypothetical protein
VNKPASLVKTWGGSQYGRLASYAVDGDTSTSDLNRCAMGDDSTNNNWLQVDLGDEYVVTSIKLYVPGELFTNVDFKNCRHIPNSQHTLGLDISATD